MANSLSKKKRLQLVRSGKLDPAMLRVDWNGVSPVTRLTPTKQEKLRKQANKHRKKWNPGGGREDSIFLCTFGSITANTVRG
ncbi:hypothetical protein BCM02_108394 [Paenibacillus methanolicus]|uniref:Uncharacterized protein n=1 Tax=Paenibacillus methanolicus TaxID=582686 RepID=A0A5S5C0N4_9BACL|nr:hypothetical protein BCM02_108394 [Paenibacillus methanolicus]